MYRRFVRHQIRTAFADLSAGDSAGLVARMHPDVHHAFPGRHALGGERVGRADVGAWFDRLFRLLPGLEFDVRTIAVDGNPLDTRVGVEWTNTGTLADGSRYANRGAHVLRLRRGKLVAFHAYLDDGAALDDALTRLEAFGLTEAGAAQIGTPASGDAQPSSAPA